MKKDDLQQILEELLLAQHVERHDARNLAGHLAGNVWVILQDERRQAAAQERQPTPRVSNGPVTTATQGDSQ